MKFDDKALGIVIALTGGALIFLAADFKTLRHINYGPGFFPTIIGVGFILCGVGIALRSAFAIGFSGPWVQLGDWSRSRRHVLNLVFVPVSVVAYILVSDRLGFFLTMLAILSTLLTWFTRKPWSSVGIALIVTLFLQEFFQGFMSVPLPWGVLEPFSGHLTWM